MTAWLRHVKKVMSEEKGKKESMGKNWFKHVLTTAKKTYKKHKKGGNDENDETSQPMTPEQGGKRRRGGKTRRHKGRKH